MKLEQLIAEIPIFLWISMSLFLLASIVQLCYYLVVFLKVARHKPGKRRKSGKSVSVIICAKNEAKNLQRFLPSILAQDYPSFEVVVVNDSSTDETEDLLSEMSVDYPHLRYTSIPSNEKFLHGKKLALTIGLKSARYDHVVLTDADCYPLTDKWLERIMSHFTQTRKIVLGYGGYERRRGLLNAIIRYDTVFTAMQYLSFALRGEPYMGVGRNLAYEKDLFFKNKGFASHYHLVSGDDDLFVNETADSGNTAVEISAESHTRSLPEITLRNWIKQKKRHITAGAHYTRKSKLRLAGEIISRILLYMSLIFIVIISPEWWPVWVVFGMVTIPKLVVFYLTIRRLKESYLLLPSLLLDPVFPLFLGIFWLSNKFEPKKQTWS